VLFRSTRIINVTTTGLYSVRVFDEEDCFANSRGVNINFKAVQEMKVLGYPGEPGFCKNDSVRVSASLGFVEYTWSTGEKGRSIYISKPGIYWVNGRANNGCERKSEEVYFDELEGAATPLIEQSGNLLSVNTGEVDIKTYKWFLNDTAISGANGKDYLINEAGIYKVEVTDMNGCKSISEEFNAILGVEDERISEFIKIYPNPGEGIFNVFINFSNSNHTRLKVTNILGETVLDFNINLLEDVENKYSIDLTNYAKGIYIIELEIGQRRIYSKLIKN